MNRKIMLVTNLFTVSVMLALGTFLYAAQRPGANSASLKFVKQS